LALRQRREAALHEAAPAVAAKPVASGACRDHGRSIAARQSGRTGARTMKRLANFFAAVALTVAGGAHAQSAEGLTLDFTGAQARGAIMVAVFDSEAAYNGGAPVRQLRLDAAAGELTARLDDLPTGEYALKVFHDIDGNGRMNTNPFGMPTEPYAFSNNAVGNMGPARWAQARFTVSGAVVQSITLR
jgi:uncharacterized protein (DUF2141 family)